MKENKTWLEEQEFLYFKRQNELMAEFHWKMARVNSEVNNENTDLWKKLRKENDR